MTIHLFYHKDIGLARYHSASNWMGEAEDGTTPRIVRELSEAGFYHFGYFMGHGPDHWFSEILPVTKALRNLRHMKWPNQPSPPMFTLAEIEKELSLLFLRRLTNGAIKPRNNKELARIEREFWTGAIAALDTVNKRFTNLEGELPSSISPSVLFNIMRGESTVNKYKDEL